jgi:organic hydroperoxide reductase OsmC/OhrA
MSSHSAHISWQRGEARFVDHRYSRAHVWAFDGGARVAGSSSPQVVPLPWSDPAAVDPEEAFVAALSSCHMLWFLGLAAQAGWVVDSYSDDAVGHLREERPGKAWMAEVELRPDVVFGGVRVPSDEVVAQLHHAAHEACFIANSVRSEVRCLGTWRHPGATG